MTSHSANSKGLYHTEKASFLTKLMISKPLALDFSKAMYVLTIIWIKMVYVYTCTHTHMTFHVHICAHIYLFSNSGMSQSKE